MSEPGGAAASVEISVTTDLESYPSPIKLIYEGFSDGLGLRVDPDVITPTIQGVTTTVWISASRTCTTASTPPRSAVPAAARPTPSTSPPA